MNDTIYTRNTTFILSGGAGRIITAIPALEKYYKQNPEDNFKVLVHGWESLFWSHPILQCRTFNVNQKGSFELHMKNNNVVVPEPYYCSKFYNKEVNLIEAFDKIINNTFTHDDLKKNVLYTSKTEQHFAKQLITELKNYTGKDKVVIFQPFGSTAEIVNNNIVDKSNRSLSLETYLDLAREMSKTAAVFFASGTHLKHYEDQCTYTFEEKGPYFRMLISLMKECDCLVGVDSVAQHVAYAVGKKGVIIMGGTDEKHFSYPQHFNIFRKKDRSPVYSPWRLSDVDCEFSDRENDGILDFNSMEMHELKELIAKTLHTN